MLTMSFPTATGLEELRDRAYRDFAELVRRAQAAGQLRSHFCRKYFVLLQMANAGVVQGTREYAPRAWRRFVGLMLDRPPGRGCQRAAATSVSSSGLPSHATCGPTRARLMATTASP